MDVNNINDKISIIKVSLNKRYDKEIETDVNTIEVNDHGYKLNVKFGKKTEEEMVHDVGSIIHNLALLKDIIKKNLEFLGLSKYLIEDYINQSQHLQVLIDLDNENKHGYPLTKPYRSGKHPIVGKLNQGMLLKADQNIEIKIDKTANINIIKGGKVIIYGDIYDRDGTHLFSIDEMFDQCLNLYQDFITKHKLIEVK